MGNHKNRGRVRSKRGLMRKLVKLIQYYRNNPQERPSRTTTASPSALGVWLAMNDPDLVNQCSIDQDDGSETRFSVLSEPSVDCESSGDTSDDQHPEKYTCKRPECEDLVFTTESEWHRHLVAHIGLPTINVLRLSESEEKKLLKKRRSSGHRAGPHSKTKKNKKPKIGKESLTVRVKKVPSSSDKRLFEVVRPTKILYGPGGIYCSNGLFDDVKEEVFEKGVSSGEPHLPGGESHRRVELDASKNEEEGAEEVGAEQLEEEKSPEEGACTEEGGDNEGGEATPEWDQNERVDACEPAPSRGTSPTPSEVLRPSGLMAPDTFGDEDSCYPHSPPESEGTSRMVELNGSGAGVSGSDNDSGHSRSPATFPGTGGGSEDDIQDSSQPNFNWDDIVNESSENTAVNTDNDADNAHSDEADVPNDLESDSGAASDSLILNDAPETSSAPTISVRDLQEFRAPNFSSNDAGQGDTEYMSLERLAESQVCCEVCGERVPNRQSLEEHRAVAGHYKCGLPDCGVVVGSAGDLAAHQASVHAGQTQLPPRVSPPVSAGPGTPPVQQLAQQVQRLPIPQQQAQPGMVPQYPGMVPPPLAPTSYPMVPQSLSPQQQLGMVPVPSISPQQQQQIVPPNPQLMRRGPTYRMPQQPGQPFGPGSPNQAQPQAPGNQVFQAAGPGPYPGQIQPRPLNTLVAPQQPIQRAPMQVRMAGPGVMVQRGMAPAVRAQKRLAPAPQAAGRGVPPPPKQRRVDVIPVAEVAVPGKKSDAKAVANILATRGITVTPAGVTRPGLTVQQVTGPQPGRARGQPIQPIQPQAPQPVTTLNLNSAISITPTGANNGRQQANSGFVVPHGRSVRSQPQTTNVERPPRPPTVDLTGDGPPIPAGSTRLQMAPMVHRGRGRPSLQQRTTCQICDKAFTSPEQLAQHMMVHRNPGKLPFRCNLCNAQYPTQQGLTQHRQTYHKESTGVGMGPALVPGEEMVIPLVDLKQPGVAARLGALGIHHCIPLSGLGNQSNGFFHLPVVSIDGSRTSAAGNLRSLGASGVLSIGPIKLVPRASQ